MKIQGRRRYLWRAIDQEGDVIDILVQSRRDRRAATRFFRKLLKAQGRSPRRLVTDKLRSYAAVTEYGPRVVLRVRGISVVLDIIPKPTLVQVDRVLTTGRIVGHDTR